MAPLELAFKVLLLGGPPLGSLIGIYRAKTFWPLAFLTFVGATITVINLRIGAQLSTMQAKQALAPDAPSGNLYHISSWILGFVILTFGLWKIQKLRKALALAKLLAEEE